MPFKSAATSALVVALIGAQPAAAASNLNSSKSNQPISTSYSEAQCRADGGQVQKEGDATICVYASKTIVKSKSNITNN